MGDLGSLDFMIVSDLLTVPTYPIALVIDKNPLFKDVKDEKEKIQLKRNIKRIFDTVVSYIQLIGMEIKSDFFRIYLENSMSIMRHELGQSYIGYNILIEQFKLACSTHREIISKLNLNQRNEDLMNRFMVDCNNFIGNSEKFLYNTEINIKSSKYLTDFTLRNKRYFYPYEEFLFKWGSIYRVKSDNQSFNFKFPLVTHSDEDRPLMFGNPDMIEQAAYNLTNNAFKYAIKGTEIFFDCVANREENRYEIIVRNLAHPFKDKSEETAIFGFGKRGSNNEKQGNGFGLYLTKRIAQAHGGDVICKMSPVSKYDISTMELYLKYYKDKQNKGICDDENTFRAIERELSQKGEKIKSLMVKPLHENIFTPMYVNNNIYKGTAEFTFIFWVPLLK